MICTASDDIWAKILDYNKGRVNCHQIVKEQIGVEVLDPAYQKEMEHRKRLMGQDDANDEMTSQQRREYEYKFNEAVNAGNIFSDDINVYIERKAQQAQVDDYLLDVEALARESYEYHHGSGSSQNTGSQKKKLFWIWKNTLKPLNPTLKSQTKRHSVKNVGCQLLIGRPGQSVECC